MADEISIEFNPFKKELSARQEILYETRYAIKAWRVWLHMGVQDISNQFRRSRLGILWLLINLSLMAGSIGYIYGHLFHQDLSVFFPQLILSLTIWNFISTTIVQGCQTFLLSEGYIKQFSFPKQIYILRFLSSALINFLVGLLVYFVVAISQHIPFMPGTLWALIGVSLLVIISVGHLVIFAYWGARIRDLSPLLSGFFLILFYITPIIFTAPMLKERGLDFIYKYNPLYYLIEVLRFPLLNGHNPEAIIYYITIGYGIIIWLLALVTLFKYDRKVAYWL